MITGYFGLPGCGKSTFLAKMAQQYIRHGYRVFVLDTSPVSGCELISWSDIGKYDMSGSVILLDEISLFADNRDYKSFAHYHCDIVWFTQQYDGVDRKIRELTTCLYYVRAAGKLSYAVRIDRFIHVEKEQKQIQVGYKMTGLFRALFAWLNHSVKVCYRPLYYKYFDSYDAPKLPVKAYVKFKVTAHSDR